LLGGPVGTITVQRTAGTQPSLVSERGLGFHLESFIGDDSRAILLDFGNTYQNLSRNYQALKIEPSSVDGLILGHGHADHYGGFLDLASATPEWADRGLSLYAGGEDTFCRPWTVTPDGTRSGGVQLSNMDVQARGIGIILAKDPTVVAGHALVSGQIARTTDFETDVGVEELAQANPTSDGKPTGRSVTLLDRQRRASPIEDVYFPFGNWRQPD
jgi:metal-dependent hydrolase (beta-lactamase superfamily II)